MAEVETAERHSCDVLNAVIDHAHLTGRDYLMALLATQARDSAVRLALLDEIKAALLGLSDDLTDDELYVLAKLHNKYKPKEPA